MNIHPVRKDINKHVGDMAVIQSIKNLISTNRTERLFNPQIGSGVRALLFENADSITSVRMEKEILQTIENYEPRAKVLSVVVTAEPDSNSFRVKITFSVVNRSEPIAITFQLERTR